MSFSINNNINTMTPNLNSNLQSNATNKSLSALSSGNKIDKAAYDASGLSISNELLAQIAAQGQEIMNANDSIGMVQVAEGGLQGINDNLDRVRVLTLQASNGTMNADNRANIQKEIDSLLSASDDITKQTSYNGMNLLDGSRGDIQDTALAGVSISSLFGSVNVTTELGRSDALGSIDDSLKSISESRATLGASQNQLSAKIKTISVGQINAAFSASQIKDVDFTEESANFSRTNLMSQTGSFAQAQSNASASSNISRLLG